MDSHMMAYFTARIIAKCSTLVELQESNIEVQKKKKKQVIEEYILLSFTSLKFKNMQNEIASMHIDNVVK